MEPGRVLSPTIPSIGSWPESSLSPWARWPAELALRLTWLMAAVPLFVSVAWLTGTHDQPLTEIASAPLVEAIRAVAPFLAAAVVVWALYRPWPAVLAVVGLTPVWDMMNMQIMVGPVQVILESMFLAALMGGLVLRRRSAPTAGWAADTADAGLVPLAWPAGRAAPRAGAGSRSLVAVRGYLPHRFAEAGAILLVGLATLSTLASRDVENSLAGLLHGVAEPVLLGAILIALKPGRRELSLLFVALAVEIGLGTAINLLQSFFSYHTVPVILAHRAFFAWFTFGNVGYYAVILATVVPLVVALIVSRRELTLPRGAAWVLGLCLALAVAGLFFSISKSAWLSTAAGSTFLFLLLLRSWWRRLAVIAAAMLLSAVVIPWPALVLQTVPEANAAYRTAIVDLVGQSRFDSWNPGTLAGHGSMVERFYALEGGVDMALDHPLLGVGLNEFQTYYLKLGYRPESALDNLDHAHSLLPEVAAELGLPAAIMLLALVGAALWAMWKTYRSAQDRATRVLAAALLASIGTWFFAANIFGCDIYRAFRDQASDVMTAAVVIALAIALARLVHSERAARAV